MTQNPRVLRGYAGALTTALNQSKDGSMIEIDVGTGQALREILLDRAKEMEPYPEGRRLYVLLWNETHPLLQEVSKLLDPYLAVDLTDAMEQVVKALPNTGTRETVSEQPSRKGETWFVAKGKVLARAILWMEPKP